MESILHGEYSYLLFIAVILLSTKFLGLLTQRFRMPQVVGALIAGVLLGPACFGLVEKTEFISSLAEIGVIVLMFTAGMETDLQELKKSGVASFLIALMGVIIPIAGGFGVAKIWGIGTDSAGNMSSAFMQQIFIGIILTATSVSITVETLKELGRLKSHAGSAILGAAVIDDILGIIALTIIISLNGGDGGSGGSIGVVLLKILGFFVVSILAAVLFHIIFIKWREHDKKDLRRHTVVCFVFCLLLSWMAEALFSVADITGAFVAGLALSGMPAAVYTAKKFEVTSYMLLSPVFFASIGLAMTDINMSGTMIVFTVVLTLVAILTKIVGCGLGAAICRYKPKECVQIGVGMISRGEVALIVANKGKDNGLISEELFAPIIIMVVVTTIVTPILLKLVFKNGDDSENTAAEPELATAEA
jgi:Kef-type K+ transport system membrane component KefB